MHLFIEDVVFVHACTTQTHVTNQEVKFRERWSSHYVSPFRGKSSYIHIHIL